PGPAPQGAAWDGYNLWAFDAAAGLLYKYGLDPKAGPSATYKLEGVKTLASMQWYNGKLWVLDGKNVLSRYELKDGLFRQVSSQVFGKRQAAAFWAEGNTLWAVEKAGDLGAGYELKRYSLKLYE
ncbi:MAG: hypothetical protein ACYC2I_07080, partial [Elusimicrobiales bacterium]